MLINRFIHYVCMLVLTVGEALSGCFFFIIIVCDCDGIEGNYLKDNFN